MGDVERGVLREEVLGRGEVGLGEHEQRVHAGVVGRDEAAVDEPGARLGVGERGHDDELVGIGDDDPLDRVGVVGGAPQDGGPLLDPHDPGEGVGTAGGVADHGDSVTDDDGGAAELAGAHGDDDPLGQALAGGDERRPAPPVHGRDPADDRVLVLGSLLGAGPGAAAVGAHPDVRLVPAARGPAHQPSVASSMPSHRWTNCGSVLPTVAGSSMTVPGARSASSAPAMTMRWSA